ncbi:hypothetical protein [Cylindrospermum stagnale]|nr:hypothetical protein [Cylindrospermum stagnale]
MPILFERVDDWILHELSPAAKVLLKAVEERFRESNLIDILQNVD